MVDGVECRLGGSRLLHLVQWLSNNGSCRRARETIDFPIWLGPVLCFTPISSPQSNGMVRGSTREPPTHEVHRIKPPRELSNPKKTGVSTYRTSQTKCNSVLCNARQSGEIPNLLMLHWKLAIPLPHLEAQNWSPIEYC